MILGILALVCFILFSLLAVENVILECKNAKYKEKCEQNNIYTGSIDNLNLKDRLL